MIIRNSRDLTIEIKTIMLKNNIKRSDLANKLNISTSALTSRLSGNNISINTFLEICNALNLDIDINFINKDDTN